MKKLQFTFTPEEESQAHDALLKNGITDKSMREKLMKQAQETGEISIFAYGSLLHTVHTDGDIVETAAFVEGKQARFSQAFTYYGGEAGRCTLMLALEDRPGEVCHGAIQRKEIKSGAAFIEYYNDLQVRENPVNNPIYNFNDTVEAKTGNGETVTCITCLSNKNGPLYLGDKLTEDEQAYILAYAMGPPRRLNNGTFRDVEGTAEGVEFADLQAHHKTGAAYVYHYLNSYRAWGFPKNNYLERMVEKINRIRRDMLSKGRDVLEVAENGSGERPDGLGPRFGDVSDNGVKETPEQVFSKWHAANEKLNKALMENEVYRRWKREWRGPDHPDLALE